MSKKQKLELTWIGKDKRPRLEPRILLEDKTLSYHAEQAVSGNDLHDNLLIHGDNLLALKALERQYAGKVKCIYIDPPYNTGSAFEYYDDGLEHSIWLSLIRNRLEIIRQLLSHDRSIWISIDDNEYPYLRILCDEIFGRLNFVCTVIWEKRKSRENRRAFSFKHDYIVVYAKHKSTFESVRNPISINQEVMNRYRNPDNDPRGAWQSVAITAQAGHGTASQFYQITTPGGRKIDPPAGNCWRFTQPKLKELITDNRIYFGVNGNNVPRQKKFLKESEGAGLTPETIWYADDVGTNDTAKRYSNSIFDGNGFDSPKPEELIQRILEIASNPNDLILDSFAGSGTTGAVAHKMGRRWIMVELGDHCQTHIAPRLKKVIDGEDQGGISKAVNWQGGGGFRYFRLASSLLKKDSWGNWIINKTYNGEMLSEAMCKHMGYTYAPSQTVFWQHGYSTESNYIYVTTGSLSYDQLKIINDEVGSERSLLICCKAFMVSTHKTCEVLETSQVYSANSQVSSPFANLTLKKIPQAVLHKCEWDHDDYSFAINVLPDEQNAEGDENE